MQLYIDSKNELLEGTEDKMLINNFYEQHYNAVFGLMTFNSLYIFQACWCILFIIFQLDIFKYTMFAFACWFMFIEFM